MATTPQNNAQQLAKNVAAQYGVTINQYDNGAALAALNTNPAARAAFDNALAQMNASQGSAWAATSLSSPSPSPQPAAQPVSQPTAQPTAQPQSVQVVSLTSNDRWNQDTATALGQLFGLLQPGDVATGGKLAAAVAAADPALANEFNRIAQAIHSGSMSANQVADYFVEKQIANQQQDPDFGKLAEAPYPAFTPFSEAAPVYKPFTMADYEQSPGYEFQLAEGQKAINKANSATGNIYSGNALKQATQYAQDLAMQDFQNAYGRYNQDFQTTEGNYLNRYNQYNTDFGIGYSQAKGDSDTLYSRLAGLANAGSSATNTAVNANQNNANAGGNIYGQVGNAQAQSSLNTGNIYGNALSSILGNSFGKSTYSGGWAPTSGPYAPATARVTTPGQLPWLL